MSALEDLGNVDLGDPLRSRVLGGSSLSAGPAEDSHIASAWLTSLRDAAAAVAADRLVRRDAAFDLVERPGRWCSAGAAALGGGDVACDGVADVAPRAAAWRGVRELGIGGAA
jgi:hypothetical protein